MIDRMKKEETSPLDIFLWQRITKHPGKILDYGCGRGRFIEFCFENGLEISGADSFKGIYKDWYNQSKRILKIRNKKIPVESNYFNIVVSNQVLEHIELSESKIVVQELMRVLSKDGFGIHIFPTRLTLIEPHVGIIGAHWIRNRRLQRYYLTLCFLINKGYWRSESKRGKSATKTRKEWVKESMKSLNDYTYFVPPRVWRDYFEQNGALATNISFELLIFACSSRLKEALIEISKFWIIRQFMNLLVNLRIGYVMEIKSIKPTINSSSNIIFKKLSADSSNLREPEIKLTNYFLNFKTNDSLRGGVRSAVEFFKGKIFRIAQD